MKVALTGNDAAATAMKHINPDVVAAYPITPQTELMHKFAELVSNGEVDTEFELVESEHSAMSAVIGAQRDERRNRCSRCRRALNDRDKRQWSGVDVGNALHRGFDSVTHSHARGQSRLERPDKYPC